MVNKEEFREYILAGTTIPQLQEIYGISRTKVAQYKREFGFVGLTPNSRKVDLNSGVKICNTCKIEKSLEEFYSNGKSEAGRQKYKPSCKICENSVRRTNWVQLIQDYLSLTNRGYSCETCKDTDQFGFLDFHHIDPSTKLFSIGDTSTYTGSKESFIEDIIPELNKCRLLCPSCHRREHLVMGRK